MRLLNTKNLLAWACCIGLMAGNAWAQSSGSAPVAAVLDGLNRAGEQRMLVQRIAKSYAQIGLNVLPLPAKQELDAAVDRFEANLQHLRGLAPEDSALAASWRRMWDQWYHFRQAAKGVPRLESAVWLSYKSDELLATTDSFARDLEYAHRSAPGRVVLQASRLRMLSQRIAKAYLLVSWGDRSSATREELDAAVAEFSGTLLNLTQRGDNSPAVAQELAELGQHWEWLQTALAAEGASTYRLIVTEAAEAILRSADRVTDLYQKSLQPPAR